MHQRTLFIVALICFSLIGCQEEFDQKLLHGSWKVDEFLETGKPKNIDVLNMGFTFNEQNIYTYQSNLKYQEAGNYRIQNAILYSTDTINDQRIEKAVEIIHITTDSLHLLMNNGGTEQKIILHKLK